MEIRIHDPAHPTRSDQGYACSHPLALVPLPRAGHVAGTRLSGFPRTLKFYALALILREFAGALAQREPARELARAARTG